MYNLGEQFNIDFKSAVAGVKSVVSGDKYRFTVLSPRVIRLEYSEDGVFLDKPTQLILHRNLPRPDFKVADNAHFLEISTKYFKLTYTKEKPFAGNKVNPTINLKVELLGTDRVWYYGHPEARNFGVPALSLDEGGTNGHGLYSADGMASIDDSHGMVWNENGTLGERNTAEVDIYLFMYNNDYEAALLDYYALTGYPALIPRYALGNWWSRVG